MTEIVAPALKRCAAYQCRQNKKSIDFVISVSLNVRVALITIISQNLDLKHSTILLNMKICACMVWLYGAHLPLLNSTFPNFLDWYISSEKTIMRTTNFASKENLLNYKRR
ncbi:hypothetical protein BpHYR1_050439 [Brachionus plicatilis]|uniref:Uncharacterized protein n=1 Tax=Brachionus plicatilis TaxID=10195 RepID=A0A3M7R8B9_BRAPC|nr:hypothetical protein BpHYR1_050439 [Brachionus plicatilis]